MKLTILGCGTSTGVPLPLCECQVCQSNDPKNRRTRCSAMLQTDSGKTILIDVGPDFRQQALREKIKDINAALFTHHHADHLLGIDDLRPFYFVNKGTFDFYSNRKTLAEIKRMFAYMFEANEEYQGSLLPKIRLNNIDANGSIIIADQEIQVLPVYHGQLEVLSFRFKNVAYVTDCNSIPENTMQKLKNLDYLVIDGLRYKEHPSHFTIPEVLKVIEELKPKKAYLTHMSHDLDYSETNRNLPNNVELAYDGLIIPL